ncbi:MAG: hypothetical protein HYX54_03170 [Chloroflexi bacterium]|nr:hypothetical protein [Chloroflexota bacterium]
MAGNPRAHVNPSALDQNDFSDEASQGTERPDTRAPGRKSGDCAADVHVCPPSRDTMDAVAQFASRPTATVTFPEAANASTLPGIGPQRIAGPDTVPMTPVPHVSSDP